MTLPRIYFRFGVCVDVVDVFNNHNNHANRLTLSTGPWGTNILLCESDKRAGLG